MAKRGGANQYKPEKPRLLFPRSEAETKIRAQIDKGRQLLDDHKKDRLDDDSAKTKVEQWEKYNKELLKSLFTSDSLASEHNNTECRVYSEFSGTWTDIFQPDPRLGKNQQDEEVKACIAVLESIIERLELYPEPEAIVSSSRPLQPTTELGSDIFLVHGHDETAKLAVARFLEKLKLKPIILHEQPNAGRTIIEKFEDHANVGFAVVLMTPDDIGAPTGERDHLKPRARQNVIFELGFFMGRLGRNRVCALYKEGVEIPSDYKGVLYIPLDDKGSWNWQLAKELKAAGLPVDLNNAIS